MSTKHPMQPIISVKGVYRFKQNAIARFLSDAGPFDLLQLASMEFSDDDREQFSQLLGYSVCGFCYLSYPSEEAKDRAEKAAFALTKSLAAKNAKPRSRK